MESIPMVVDAKYENGYRIRIVFSDGQRKMVDFESWLEGPVFEPLRDQKYFQEFFIEGGTIVWPNGADIAPETLYDSKESTEAA